MIIKQYALYENVQQAKKLLADNNKDINDPEVGKNFEKIKNLLSKKPNLVKNFTKYFFIEKIPFQMNDNGKDEYFESLVGMFNYINRENDNIKKFLPQDVVKYETFEELSDDIRNIQDDIIINKFLKNLYPKLRKDININDDSNRDIIIKFMKLPESKRKNTTPLKYFIKNNKTGQDYINHLKEIIDNDDNNRESTIKLLEGYKSGDTQLVYDKDGILIIRTFNKELIKKIGSSKWCIVYNQDHYYDKYISPLSKMTQYIILNFNVPSTDKGSMYGVSVDSGGNTSYGASQNKLNEYTQLSIIGKETGLGSHIGEILKPHVYSSSIIMKNVPMSDILSSPHVYEYISPKEIHKMNLSSEEKVLKKLYKNLTVENVKNLDVVFKVEHSSELSELGFDIKDYITPEDMHNTDIEFRLKYSTYLTLSGVGSSYGYGYEKWFTEEEIRGIEPSIRMNFDLPIYDDELRNIPLSFKLDNKLKLTDVEYNSLSWEELFKYRSDSLNESEMKRFRLLTLGEILKINTSYIILEDNNPSIFKSSKYDIYCHIDSIIISAKDDDDDDDDSFDRYFVEPIRDISGMDTGEIYDYLGVYQSDDIDEDADYIAYYFSDEVAERVKTLMDILNFEYTDIEEEGLVKEFLKQKKEYLKYEYSSKYTQENKVYNLDMDSFMDEYVEGKGDNYYKNRNKLEEILPYKLDDDGVILYRSYIYELIEEEGATNIKNIDDLINLIEPVSTIIEKHNKKVEDGDDKIVNDFNYNSYGGIIDSSNILSHLDGIIENLTGGNLVDDVKKANKIFSKLKFKDDIYENDTIKIEILETDYLKGETKIKRTNKKTSKEEVGWVKLDNLHKYMYQDLLDHKVYKFKDYIQKK